MVLFLCVGIALCSVAKLTYAWLSQQEPIQSTRSVPVGKIRLDGQGIHLVMGSQVWSRSVRVDIPDLWIDTEPVTVGEYREFTENTGRAIEFYPFLVPGQDRGGGSPLSDDHPAIIGHPSQADAYCAWRGERLLMESEWLLAACGTDGRVFPSGDVWVDGRANVNSTGPVPVSSFPEDHGASGIRGVMGNVIDIVLVDKPGSGPRYALRGGGWDMTQEASQCDARIVLDVSYQAFVSMQVGFRCAQVVQP